MIDNKFDTSMARGWAVLMDTTLRNRREYEYEEKFADSLHNVMGYGSHLGNPDLEF
jgi:hypothetical protein